MWVEYLKDFAAPGATIIAAVVVTSVTAYFAKRQKDIALQQKEIARDKLWLDLFDRRYRAFESIFDYYSALIGWNATEADQAARGRCFRAYQESKFLFGPEVEAIFKELVAAADKVVGFKETSKDLQAADREAFLKQFNETNHILLHTFERGLANLTAALHPYMSFRDTKLMDA